MISPRRLFRAQALEQYAKGREKDVLPRAVAPPVFLFLWMLLGLLVTATVLAWQTHVPTYALASGVLVQQTGGGTMAVVFVPASPPPTLQVGQRITLQLAVTGQQFNATIATVEPGVMTPEAARAQYQLTGDLVLVVTQPSVVVTVHWGSAVPAAVFAGSSVNAQVQVGSRSLLSLLPDLLQGTLGG
ncbi:MAG TPA: hypothetical protein VKT82_01410 [Ktedonobacterales bacterium]|nr:hypothetical protein [Ktedonobacterales bacterium]